VRKRSNSQLRFRLLLLQTMLKFRCGCGRGEPSLGAEVAEASPVPVQMWQGRAHLAMQSIGQARHIAADSTHVLASSPRYLAR
jgi:hypothetical protein